MSARWFAEDLEVGRRFDLGERTLTADEVKAFARDWDPLPFHLDDRAAAEGPFGELVASGLHSLAVVTRLVADAVVLRTAVIAGLGADGLRMRAPVRPGVPLIGTATVAEQRLRDDGRGVIALRCELRDPGGTLLLEHLVRFLVRRRPGED
ncbi:MaoC/PaaZ C-terminal domain-containing protein [Conexibacter sp. SYSU D00693]|uniref:MaoC/PaaZ C-terminal domain-containing protein n=1 Tax=Conexibacter sp. SYSU D00693 TaxID=2812560 RepID=UPI00196AF0A7|nr:MaoC/PaaZ C-terminal domain-containing protein [Conexibacter sp. SYSU D00693]